MQREERAGIEMDGRTGWETMDVGCVPLRKTSRVSGWEATHWRRARALQTRFDAWGVNSGGFSSGYTEMISWSRVDITPGISQPKKKAKKQGYPVLNRHCRKPRRRKQESMRRLVLKEDNGQGQETIPKECHRINARSSYCSLFLLNSNKAFSRPSGPLSN